ncbi:hypothetical protein HY745_03655 [Candidatus Desantisbacteria bacterium]|nr:hypothetical protein [Candidatus Desantisbacteria bacterium]
MTENREIAFKDGIEHITAEMNLIRIMLAEKTAKMAERFESDKSSSFRGYGISPDEAFHWLKQADENPGVVAPENSGLTGIISKRLEESKQEGIYLPLVKLGQAFGLSRLEIKILLTCLLPEFYPGFSKVFGFLQDDAALQYPSIGFIMELYCKNQRERGFAWDIFHSGSKLRSWELLVPFNNDIQLPLLKKAYRIDERIVTFLMGSTRFDGRIEETAEISYPTGGSHGLNYKPAFENIVKSVMEGRECCLVTLAGNNIEGAYGFAADTAAKLGWNLVKVPLSFIFRQNEWDLKNINILLREAVLLPAVLLFYGDRSVQSESNVDHIPLLKLFARKGILIFFQGNISAGLPSNLRLCILCQGNR